MDQSCYSMKAVMQRVSQAAVYIDEEPAAQIGIGLLVLLGIEDADGADDVEWLASKVVNLRIFADEQQMMNKNLSDVDGELLIVSQFTLHASTKKGNRPSFIKAAKPELAIPLYEAFVSTAQTLLGKEVQTGRFGADMQVSMTNDGPVTIIIDTKDKK